jgi:hypothetical protein
MLNRGKSRAIGDSSMRSCCDLNRLVKADSAAPATLPEAPPVSCFANGTKHVNFGPLYGTFATVLVVVVVAGAAASVVAVGFEVLRRRRLAEAGEDGFLSLDSAFLLYGEPLSFVW